MNSLTFSALWQKLKEKIHGFQSPETLLDENRSNLSAWVKVKHSKSKPIHTYLLVSTIPATTRIPEFTRIPEKRATTIFSGIRVGICIITTLSGPTFKAVFAFLSLASINRACRSICLRYHFWDQIFLLESVRGKVNQYLFGRISVPTKVKYVWPNNRWMWH